MAKRIGIVAALLICVLAACSREKDSGGAKAAIAPPALPPSQELVVTYEPKGEEKTGPLSALLPPEGPKFAPLFNGKLANTDDRFSRLENVVQGMRNDLDTVMPAMARMTVVADKTGETVETATPPAPVAPATDPIPVAASTPEPTPEPAPVAAQPQAPAAAPVPSNLARPPLPDLLIMQDQAKKAAATAAEQKTAAPQPQQAPLPQTPPKGDIKAIRIADHDDKTRIVLDMTAEITGTIKMDNGGKTLVVAVPQFNWLGAKSKEFDSAELISGYHVADGNLYIDLIYPARIKERRVLVPGKDSRDYRAVIDLVSPDVHKKK